MSILRISHPAFSGSRRDETLHFYRDVLAMEVVLQQDNLDYPSEDHFFFHVGGDNFIAYFLPKPGADVSKYQEATPGWSSKGRSTAAMSGPFTSRTPTA